MAKISKISNYDEDDYIDQLAELRSRKENSMAMYQQNRYGYKLTPSKVNILKALDALHAEEGSGGAWSRTQIRDRMENKIATTTFNSYLSQLRAMGLVKRDRYNYNKFSRTEMDYPGSDGPVQIKETWMTPLQKLAKNTSNGIKLEEREVKVQVNERSWMMEKKVVMKITTKALNPDEVKVVCDCLNNYLSELIPKAQPSKKTK